MIFPLVIAAGATVQCPFKGDRFELVQSPIPLNIRAGQGNAFSSFAQQTGQVVKSGFSLLEVQNPSATQIVAQIFVADGDDFIDNRNLPSPQQPNVIYINPTVGVLSQWLDQSGNIITDPYGNQWWIVEPER